MGAVEVRFPVPSLVLSSPMLSRLRSRTNKARLTERRYTKAGIADRVRVQPRNDHQLAELPPSFEHTFDALVACEMVSVCLPPFPLAARLLIRL